LDAYDDQTDATAWLIVAIDRRGGPSGGGPFVAVGGRRR
jgi:hypothetical protein